MQNSLAHVALRQITNGSKAGRRDRESHAAQYVSAATNLIHIQDLECLVRKLCGALVGFAELSKSMHANTRILSESIGQLRRGLNSMNESVNEIKID